ncbi:YdhR family protein [Pelagibius marinus]|uniref:YdhR family protein n=1 Tax=Pelagibius marinus TaxID=2762760 RepID=UPI001873168C|nr:YdhR family protein [Pelagibius marinus]
MITAIVQFKLPSGIKREDVIAAFNTSVEQLRGYPGLIRKYYLYDEAAGTAGGAYLWENRAAAEALYSDAWLEMIAERYGGKPQITWFETPVVLDNASGEVLSEAAE